MEIIATGGLEGKITMWDYSSCSTIAALEGHTHYVTGISFSPCGSFLVSWSDDSTIIVWDCQLWTRSTTIKRDSSPVISVSWNRSSDQIALVSCSGSVCLWCLTTDCVVTTLETGGDEESAVVVSFKNTSDDIAVACGVLMNIYDSLSGQLKQSVTGLSDGVLCIQFSPDDSMLVSGSCDNSLIIWDVATSAVAHMLEGHEGPITQVSFSADGSRLVSSSCDKTARVWEVYTGKCQLVISGHTERVSSCCFSEDDNKVLTKSEDGMVKVWSSYSGEELRSITDDAVASVACRSRVIGSYI